MASLAEGVNEVFCSALISRIQRVSVAFALVVDLNQLPINKIDYVCERVYKLGS